MARPSPFADELARDCGLVWPASPRGGTWPRDPHMLAALAAALPVWLLLGWFVGTQLYAPADAAAWLGFVLLRPMLEELVFRGLVQGTLMRLTSRRVAGLSLANLITSALFAAAHLLTQPLAWALAVAVPSLLFGHLRERLRSVLPPALLHVVYNAGFGMVAVLARA